MAGARIEIKVDDREVMDYLNRLTERIANLRPVLVDIGEQVMIQTKSRIESGGPAPDGEPWAPLSPRYARRKAKMGAGGLPIPSSCMAIFCGRSTTRPAISRSRSAPIESTARRTSSVEKRSSCQRAPISA